MLQNSDLKCFAVLIEYFNELYYQLHHTPPQRKDKHCTALLLDVFETVLVNTAKTCYMLYFYPKQIANEIFRIHFISWNDHDRAAGSF